VNTAPQLVNALVPHQQDASICGLIVAYYLVALRKVWRDSWHQSLGPATIDDMQRSLLSYAVDTGAARALELRRRVRTLLASGLGIQLERRKRKHLPFV
jgi:hypothetical protein